MRNNCARGDETSWQVLRMGEEDDETFAGTTIEAVKEER
jgi:hypothetical protein